jgi:hypothetical protein
MTESATIAGLSYLRCKFISLRRSRLGDLIKFVLTLDAGSGRRPNGAAGDIIL